MPPNLPPLPFRQALALVLLGSTLIGCGDPSPDQLVSSAKALMAKGDARAAIVELKAAAAARPDYAEARFLLGKALLELDEPVTAIVELTKAEQAGYPTSAVTPTIARAYLAQRDYRKVLSLCDTASLVEEEGKADCKVSTATAHAALGNVASAEEDLAEALRMAPGFVQALVVQARVLAAKGDLDGALKAIDAALNKAPDLAEALVVKGDILGMGKGESEEPLNFYRRAIAAHPAHAAAHGRLLFRLLGRNDVAGAKQELDKLQQALPGSATTRYFQARIALAEGKLPTAESLTQQLVKAAPDNPDVLMLAGIVALEQNSALRAEAHLTKALLAAPDDPALKRLLARAHIASGNADRALDLLRLEIAGNTPTKDALSLAATAHFQAGNPARAQELLERAARQDPSATDIQTRLALARMSGPAGAAAIGDLESIADQEGGLLAALALVPIHANRGDFDSALKAIDRIASKEPGKPRPETLRAQVLALRGDFSGARRALERALALDPTFFVAVSGLAALDLREGKTDSALGHYRGLLEKQPKNVQALLAVAELTARSGQPKAEIARLYDEAIAADPTRAETRRALVEFYLSRRDPNMALEAAQAANAALPDRPDVLELLGRTQLMAGETSQAISTFGRLSGLAPQSTRPLLGLVDANLAGDRIDAARMHAQKALAMSPTDPEAIRRLLTVETRSAKWKEARKVAQEAQHAIPARAVGFEGEGDIERAQGNWSAAVAAYELALRKEANTAIAQKLHTSLQQAGKSAAAEQWASRWVKDNPRDARFLSYLGARSLAAKDYAGAEARFAQVLRLEPDDAVALNNLAWSLHRQNKPGGLVHAERANRLLPEEAGFMDTLAALLAQDRKFKQAIDLQKRAIELQPRQPQLQLNLARIYIQAGDRSSARAELDELLEKTSATTLAKEAQALRASL